MDEFAYEGRSGRANTCSDVIAVPADQYQHLVEKGLVRLSEQERRAVYLRFWRRYSINKVSGQMNLSWSGAARLIDGAVTKIRAVFVEHGHQKTITGAPT